MRHILAIDIAGGSLAASFVSDSLDAADVSRLDLAGFAGGDIPPKEKLVALLSAKMHAAPGDVCALSIALDCDLSPDRRSIVNSSGAGWMSGEPLADILESAFGKPVILDRRAQVFLDYDRMTLGLPSDSLIVGCYINNYYENAIWCGGAMMTGKSGMAGNIGHMPVHGREDNCYCGKCGCAELYGSNYRLRQIHSLIFPDIPYEEIFDRHADHPILQDFLHMMVYPIAVEVNLLDPDFLVIGGDIPAMSNFPLRNIEALLREQTYQPFPSERLCVTPSSINTANAVVYAAHYGFEKLDNPER